MSHRHLDLIRPIRALVVFGTRPEAIKLLEIIRVLREDRQFDLRVVSTGQHREMVDQILSPFGIVLDRDLAIMQPGQSLNEIVSRAMPQLEALYEEERPDIVIVQGDTTSAFCAALAAFHRRIPVAHVEAGLRSFDRGHPYPEEVNRRMISAVADLHLAPTSGAAAHLVKEGIDRDRIVVSGNTVVDTLLLTLRAKPAGELPPPLDDLPHGAPLVLITLHRRESWAPAAGNGRPANGEGDGAEAPLERILLAIREVADAHPEATFVYPVHLNPRVQEPARRILDGAENVFLIEPLPYVPFVHLMARASIIISDSGGIQEEAPSLGVPLLILRETTERPEGLQAGTNRLLGTCPDRIREVATQLLRAPAPLPAQLPCPSPYGDGLAHERIRQAILHHFGLAERAHEFIGDLANYNEGDTDGQRGAAYG